MTHSPACKEFIDRDGEMDETTLSVGLADHRCGVWDPGWEILTQSGVGTSSDWEIIILVIVDLMSQ